VRNRLGKITALTLTLLIVFPLAIVAANWQWNRHHERESLNSMIQRAYDSEPYEIESISDINDLKDLEYVRVQIEGKSSGDVVWWRKQSLDGIPGFIGLIRYNFGANENVVLALGWTQTIPQAQSVEISNITARIRLIDDFASDPRDLPNGQTNSPANVLPEKDKIYLELKDPEVSLFVPLPLPQMTAGPHLGYVGQWILIAIFAIAVYVIALRNLPKN
jgi:cytochrome oxidase assembly protein ShyY1